MQGLPQRWADCVCVCVGVCVCVLAENNKYVLKHVAGSSMGLPPVPRPPLSHGPQSQEGCEEESGQGAGGE